MEAKGWGLQPSVHTQATSQLITGLDIASVATFCDKVISITSYFICEPAGEMFCNSPKLSGKLEVGNRNK